MARRKFSIARAILALTLLGGASLASGCGGRSAAGGQGGAGDAAGGDARARPWAEAPAAEREEWRRGAGVIDMHGHIAPASAREALAAMDRNGIAVLVNLTTGRTPEEFAAAKAAFDAVAPGRFIHYANDTYAAFDIDDPDYGAKVSAAVEGCAALGARGFKVSKTLGLYWKDRAGKTIAVDDPRLEPLWETCRRLALPISIHTGDPKAFWLPVDERNERYDELRDHPNWAFGGGQFPAREALLEQLERLVASHPGNTFVGVHFGNDPEDVDHVSALLRRHPNYNVDLAARIPEIGRQPPEKLRALFIEHQDRILFGTDFMASPQGYILGAGPRLRDEGEVDRFFEAHWRFLETKDRGVPHPTPIQGRWTMDCIGLEPPVLEKIYRRNAERILGMVNR